MGLQIFFTITVFHALLKRVQNKSDRYWHKVSYHSVTAFINQMQASPSFDIAHLVYIKLVLMTKFMDFEMTMCLYLQSLFSHN
jgi:hypothetical protein